MTRSTSALSLILQLLFLPAMLAVHADPLSLAPRATSTSTSCAADNCLRALSNAYTATPSGAQSFCSTYTQTRTTSSSIPIPTYATSGCANNPSRVSSACTCLATSYYQPKPFHRVYGGTNGINGTTYTIYDEALNIRSDDYPSGTYDEYLGRCRTMCDYYGNGCQTFSFVMNGLYLCYIYAGLYDPAKLTYYDGNTRNVVEQRYQI